MDRTRPHGFTLVELIVVILLLAIISLYAASRYSGRNDVAARVVQEQVISVVRQVQVNRMQSNVGVSSALATDSNFVLRVDIACVGSGAGCEQMSDSRSDWVRSDVVTFTSNPPNSIYFDLLGNPAGLAASGATITVTSSEQSCTVTINTQGYVSTGGCS